MKINEIIIPTSLWQQHEDCIPRELMTCQDRHSSGFLLNVLFWQQEGACATSQPHQCGSERGRGLPRGPSTAKLICSPMSCRMLEGPSVSQQPEFGFAAALEALGSHTRAPLPAWVRRCTHIHRLRNQSCWRYATRQFPPSQIYREFLEPILTFLSCL